MEEGHQFVSAAELAQALRSKVCSSHDLAAKNSPGPRRRAPPVGIGTKEQPGDESACARGVCQHHVLSAITDTLHLPARFSREEASSPGEAASIPPHSWVSGSGSHNLSSPVSSPVWLAAEQQLRVPGGDAGGWRCSGESHGLLGCACEGYAHRGT